MEEKTTLTQNEGGKIRPNQLTIHRRQRLLINQLTKFCRRLRCSTEFENFL